MSVVCRHYEDTCSVCDYLLEEAEEYIKDLEEKVKKLEMDIATLVRWQELEG